MRVIIFGASGMVGQGVLRVALESDEVTEVRVVVRRLLPLSHHKLRQIVHTDFADYSTLGDDFTDLDACFFCLGVSSVGKNAQEYARVSYDYPMAAAHALQAASPGLVFTYVSGEGTDATEQGRIRWARVKGRTENELLAMPIRAHMFRAGLIRPLVLDGVPTTALRTVYGKALLALHPLLRRASPAHVTTGEAVGRAMLALSRPGTTAPGVLTTHDINRLGA